MERLVVLPEEIKMILDRLEKIESLIEGLMGLKDDVFLDSQEFLQKMHISKRCAQNWRDEGTIAYSQVGSKIYYWMKDIKAMLEKHYHEKRK